MPTGLSRTKEEAQDQLIPICFTIALDTVTAADIVAEYPLLFDGEVDRLLIFPSSPTTTASDAATFAVQLSKHGAADAAVTGASIATTSANTDAFGEAPLSGAASGSETNKSFANGDTLFLVASSVTDYAEGVMNVHIWLRRKS